MHSQHKRLYWVWADMLSRCRNPNHKQFKDYGGRGISVCPEWTDFAAFQKDMGPRPKGGMLDREDNNGNYEPSNCRWATRKEQNSNRRNCIFIQDGSEKVTLKEYCRRRGLPYRPIVKRIQDRNWPIDKALSTPVGTGKHFKRVPPKVDLTSLLMAG
jgi:hypothetical protein